MKDKRIAGLTYAKYPVADKPKRVLHSKHGRVYLSTHSGKVTARVEPKSRIKSKHRRPLEGWAFLWRWWALGGVMTVIGMIALSLWVKYPDNEATGMAISGGMVLGCYIAAWGFCFWWFIVRRSIW